MICIDDRIVIEKTGIFSEMVGSRMLSYKHDPFQYTDSVYGISGLFMENQIYAVTNRVEVRDYYGSEEDVAIFKVSHAKADDIHSYIQGESLINIPVNQVIKKILVVNEHQCLFENDSQTYDVWLTRGFVIGLEDGLQICFEKDIWFSEDINIKRGYRLEEQFMPMDSITDDWESPLRLECERKTVVFEMPV